MATAPLDIIHIRDLRVRCIIGIKPEERIKQQDLLISVSLEADLGAACRSDRLEDTINYRSLKKRIMAMAEASSFFLLEHMAEEIAAICLEPPGVARVRILVEKPGALRFARTVGVEIVRERARGTSA